MRVFNGEGISNGIAIGKALLILDEDLVIIEKKLSPEEVELSFKRFLNATEMAKDEIREVKNQVKSKVTEEHAFIFDTHILLIEDKSLHQETHDFMMKYHCNAEWAFNQVLIRLMREFDALDDPYFMERARDLEDVGKRVLRILLKEKEVTLEKIEEDIIVIGHEFGPSNITKFDNPFIKGFATDIGGQTTHTAIIAKALKIPAVLGLHNITQHVKAGKTIILDSINGKLISEPDEKTIRLYRKKSADYQKEHRDFLKELKKPGISKDGLQVSLLANIELALEAKTANELGADGIGLYRTEFLFLNSAPDLPTEEDHYQTYCTIAREMLTKPLTIRTLDLGGEKYFHKTLIHKQETNPVMGLRGVRLCLFRKDIFRTQLRGLLRAAEEFPSIRIMFPMITSLDELQMVLEFYHEVRNELKMEIQGFSADPKIGIMIEVPSAAMTADYLAKEVDFFSIGTNDLMQYLLAIDRGNDEVSYLNDPFHPGFVRTLHQVLKAAKENGIEVACCGEIASSPLFVCLLVHLGLRELSMSPASIPNIHHFVRSINFKKLRKSVPDISENPSAFELRQAYLGAVKKHMSKQDHDHFFGESD